MLLKRGGKHSPYLAELDRWLEAHGYAAPRADEIARVSDHFRQIAKQSGPAYERWEATHRSWVEHKRRLEERGVGESPYKLVARGDRGEAELLVPETGQISELCDWLSKAVQADPDWHRPHELLEIEEAVESLKAALRALRKAQKKK